MIEKEIGSIKTIDPSIQEVLTMRICS